MNALDPQAARLARSLLENFLWEDIYDDPAWALGDYAEEWPDTLALAKEVGIDAPLAWIEDRARERTNWSVAVLDSNMDRLRSLLRTNGYEA